MFHHIKGNEMKSNINKTTATLVLVYKQEYGLHDTYSNFVILPSICCPLPQQENNKDDYMARKHILQEVLQLLDLRKGSKSNSIFFNIQKATAKT